jgi:ketosteroid isomerase-like protein
MSEQNVELAYRAFDAFARHDLDAFVAFHDPDCEIQPLLAAVGGNYHGHDGVREWWGDLFDAFPDFSFRFNEVRELGDRTLARRVSVHGAHGMDSVAPMVEQMSWILAEMSDEKVVWVWCTCSSETEALEAARLRE